MVYGIFVVAVTFAAMILVHEFGHLTAAKLCGVEVKEFALGFGPKLISRKFGETEYSLRLIPLGGFNDIDIDREKRGNRDFYGQSLWKRIIILVMGSCFNIASAVVAFFLMAMIYGAPASGTRVSKVVDDTPAAAYFMAGDDIISVDGHDFKEMGDDGSQYIRNSEKIEFVVDRNGKRVSFIVEKPSDSPVGVQLEMIGRPIPFVAAVKGAVLSSWRIIVMLGDSISAMLAQETPITSSLSGPVGVSNAIYQMNSMYGIQGVLILFAAISINLGFMNLLPIPMLDGGHIMLQCADEVVMRTVGKQFTERQVEFLTYIGATCLGVLFLLGLYADFVRLSA